MDKDIIKRIGQVVATFVLQGLLLFVFAGTLSWSWAWVFLMLEMVVLIINYRVLPREVIAERGREKKNVKPWDRILMSISIVPALGVYALSGLDFRLSWSPYFSFYYHIIGLVILLLGSMLFTWSMASNKFFSTMVCIQEEGVHRIAEAGPYRYIRHPGYVGYILMSIATPIALGSGYALLMSFPVIIIFIIRTGLEDKTLLSELNGYKEYAQKVKYRLVPFLW